MSENELFVLHNGRMILAKELSDKMYKLKQCKPEYNYEWSEMGVADLFGKLYSNEAQYCPEQKSWYTYSEGAWRKDEGAILVSEKIKECVRLMVIYCGEIEDDDKRKAYTGFVNKLGDRRLRDRVLKDAAGVLRISAVKFDANPYLINCKNGTYDLSDFSFREASPDDFITMQTNFEFTVDRNVRCKRWEAFIDEVTEGDKAKADFLQRALGYSMLGTSHEECMFILHGKTTRNGKSTLLNTVETMMGDYAKVAPVGMICRGDRQKDEDSASPTLVGLKGKRFVTMAESDEYGRLDEEKIKQLTGGEEISARALYQSAITFKPQFTMWLSCNDLPAVRDKSLFASDRIKIVEFNRHFTPQEQDTHLKDELTTPEAMKGVFMWLILGYRKYLSVGLEMSDSMRKVISQYAEENDLTLQFLRATCKRDADCTVSRKDLYKKYKQWCKAENHRVITGMRFKNDMELHQDWYEKYSDKTEIYSGLGWKDVSL
ncbi:MAG: phage/plasmid primase, P4 family [Firmicutes bacterium]|nr:phage/plasmid primase, P4 family [Bacillota bacterium]